MLEMYRRLLYNNCVRMPGFRFTFRHRQLALTAIILLTVAAGYSIIIQHWGRHLHNVKHEDEGTKCVSVSYERRAHLQMAPLQVVNSPGYLGYGNFYLYAAYLDMRGSHGNVTNIRVTGMMEANRSRTLVQCQLWYGKASDPDLVTGDVITIWQWAGAHLAVMVTCPVPQSRDIPPSHVSVVEHPCDTPDNLLPVHAPPERNETVAVCTKVTYGTPDARRLVEWVEMNRILGVERIYMYNASVRGRADDVLHYYHRQGYVHVTQHEFPDRMSRRALRGPFPTPDLNQNWLLEVLSMTDCLYRAHAHYLVNIDIDEVLYLTGGATYAEFVSVASFWAPRSAGYHFHTAVFSDELRADDNSRFPPFLHVMTHTRRTRVDWESPKSVLRADCCLATGHHYCLHAVPGCRQTEQVTEEVGYVRHYRKRCRLEGHPRKCEELLARAVWDTGLEGYGEELQGRVAAVLGELGFLIQG